MATESQITTFMQTFGRLAVAECNRRIASGLGFVLPSVCLAQSALETGYGTAGIMTRANAYFGIKAGGSWTGAVYRADTKEVANGVEYNTVANFRAYNSKEESVADYYDMITRLSRYANAISYGADPSKWLSAKETVTALWKGGYATDELYVQKIMNMVNYRDMTQFDALITGVSEGVTPVDPPRSFTLSDMVQGSLIVSDAGRSFQNDRTVTNAIALNWDNAFTVENNTTYKIIVTGVPDGYTFHFARLSDDNPVSTPYMADTLNLTGFTVYTGEKIGFYLSHEETLDITALQDVAVTFAYADLPTGSGTNLSGTIAFFVKIE